MVLEPFAGAAGYATFYNAPYAHLIDADPIIVGVWNYLLKATANSILALPEMPDVGDSVDNYSISQEAKWLIGFWLNRGSAQPKKSRTAYSARTDRGQLNWGQAAKVRIAAQLPGILGWSCSLGQYHEVGDISATWFIDPPYGDKSKHYRVKFSAFDQLGPWCLARKGHVIVCEGADATWLPFKPLGSFKSSRGKAAEAVFTRGEVCL